MHSCNTLTGGSCTLDQVRAQMFMTRNEKAVQVIVMEGEAAFMDLNLDLALGFSPATPDTSRRPALEAIGEENFASGCFSPPFQIGDHALHGSSCYPMFATPASLDEAGDGFDLNALFTDGLAPEAEYGASTQTLHGSSCLDDGVHKLANAVEQIAIDHDSSAAPPPSQQQEDVAHVDASCNAATPIPTPQKAEFARTWRKKKSTKGKIRMKVVKEGRRKATPKPATPKTVTPKKVRQKRKRKDAKSSSSVEMADDGNNADSIKPVRRKLDFGNEPPPDEHWSNSPVESSENAGRLSRAVLMDNLNCIVDNFILSDDQSVHQKNKRGKKKKRRTSKRQNSDQSEVSNEMDEDTPSSSPTSQALAVAPYQHPAEITDASSAFVPDGNATNGMNVAKHAIVPHLKRQKKLRPKVQLDPETNRVWNVLMQLEASNNESFEGADIGSGPAWEEERTIFEFRVDVFICILHAMIGNRKFSPWKGSVVDSVVGAFLTQNVSDNLSSNAFMIITSKFLPRKKDSKTEEGSEVSSVTNDGGENLDVKEKIDSADSVFSEVGNNSDLDEELEEDFSLNKDDKSNRDDTRNFLTDELGNPRYGKGIMKKFTATSKQEDTSHWDNLRKEAYRNGYKHQKSSETSDSVDWEALKDTPAAEIAKAIKGRGQHYLLACRIKAFLERIKKDHGSIDLEWLRDVPPENAKNYLLSIVGLGDKSVDCIRLLSLRHRAFPVDTNVARICTRLGWVQLQPLPSSAEFHLVDEYPIMADIQKYLWPRLCTIDKLKLYELHCLMITFGKIICTKRRPNCGACPFRADCKYYNSSFARPTLPWRQHEQQHGPEQTSMVSVTRLFQSNITDMSSVQQMRRHQNDGSSSAERPPVNSSEPIVEMPPSPQHDYIETESEQEDELCGDIEDSVPQDYDVEVKLSSEKRTENMGHWRKGDGKDIVINPHAAFAPMPKLKSKSRLRTEYNAYVLPDDHPLLQRFERREFDDQYPYLFIIRTPDKIAGTCTLCDKGNNACSSEECTVRGTILIPCRTANRGSFPLNGTYFQFNEVFADHSSSHAPITIPREYIWNLERRIIYFGSSVHSITRDLRAEGIRDCFKEGYICVRGFHRKTRLPTPLCRNIHAKETNQSGKKRSRSSPKGEKSKTSSTN